MEMVRLNTVPLPQVLHSPGKKHERKLRSSFLETDIFHMPEDNGFCTRLKRDKLSL